jgi:thimet oligopeptidase
MRQRLHLPCAVVVILAALLIATTARAADEPLGTPFISGISDPDSLTRETDARITHARALLDAMLAVKGRRTLANTLRPYDDMLAELDTAATAGRVLAAVHPDASMRRAGEQANRTANAFQDEIRLRPDVYEAIRAIDRHGANPETRYYIDRELRDFRLAGVDKPSEVRERITTLRDQLTAAMAEFQRNIREGGRKVVVRDRAELAGLPQDFIARHPADAAGAITLSTDAVDARPVILYAANDDLRRRMYVESQNVGYPQNADVLKRMLVIRAQLAEALGFQTWADFDTASRMSGDPKTVSDFIDKVVAASGAGAAREYAELLARKQQDAPGVPFTAFDRQRYAELVRRANYEFDSQSVRPYFPFERVLHGVLDVTSGIFGVTFRQVTVAAWDPSVLVYEMSDASGRLKAVPTKDSRLLGRVYLDLHPRANKDTTGATTYTVRMGVEGRQIPESVLVTSLSGGQPGDPGLMTHDEVRTLFHEFGHVIHRLLGGHQQWNRLSSVALERDFAEAPSQMLEEWIWDPATLAIFARHYQSGEPIPAALVTQMRRASEFGKALDVRQQMVFARMSLAYHQTDPARLDPTQLAIELHNKYLPYPQIEGTHREAQFSHLGNSAYASTYYTYMWSLVIAKDMFSRFDRAHLSAPAAAMRYRMTVFAPGSSKPAATLVRDFLGRPFDFTAWQAWLNGESRASTRTQSAARQSIPASP